MSWPRRSSVSGRATVLAFLGRLPLAAGRRWRLVPVRAGGQTAFGHYLWDAQRRAFCAHSITVLTLQGAEIVEITAFLTGELFERFGLPDETAS